MTPDEGYIMDIHPRWDNVIVGAGFSGELVRAGMSANPGWFFKNVDMFAWFVYCDVCMQNLEAVTSHIIYRNTIISSEINHCR